MQISPNELIFTKATDIHEICAPLKNHLNIPNFGYNKLFSDGAETDFGTCPELIKHYREEVLHQHSLYGAHPENYQSGFILWSQVETHDKILETRSRFQINDGITFINKLDDAVEFFHFEMKEKHQSNTAFYLNNLDLLESFSYYFKQQAADLIQLAENNKFYLKADFSNKVLPNLQNNQARQNFMEKISQSTLQETSLTLRQKECLYFLVKGMTIKQIGLQLSLSAKTIEHYLENLKNKLGCESRHELIAKALTFTFIKQQLFY